MTDLNRWMAQRAKKDKALYKKYGRPLEKKYRGKLAAIGPDGDVILGNGDVEVADKAIKKFGSGNFGFFKIGYPYTGEWLTTQNK